MEREGSSAVVTEVPPSSSSAAASASASAAVESIHEEAVHTTLNESMEPGTYPERPGKQDCAYYIRTGLCRFGMSCKFNHPSNRKLAVAAARNNGGYPERLGQPECQYYLKTGTCKFGATCKFHHPRDKAGIDGQVQFNSLGYPLRPNEKECTYYLRTGQCKFGSTCKFHHPQPSNAMVAAPVYTSSNSPTNPNQQSYPGGLTNWALPRASFIPSPRWQGHSTYTQLILPQGVVQVPNWTPYSAHLGSSSLESQQTLASSQTNVGVLGTSSSYRSGSFPMGMYSVQQESIYPERPDQPECQFYMKTGDCKFGAVCKFNHPRERSIPPPDCALNPLGLPLRPGEPVCGFYSRYGICKFGPNCKFDHPMATFAYGPSTAPGGSVPAVRYILGSPSGTSSAYSMQDPPSVSWKVSTANENAEEYI